MGQAMVPLSKILQAPLKQTPQAMVRVYDDYVDIKDAQTGHQKGNMRVLIYLEDNGLVRETSKNGVTSLQKAREMRNKSGSATPQ